jgi:hypothetical protein
LLSIEIAAHLVRACANQGRVAFVDTVRCLPVAAARYKPAHVVLLIALMSDDAFCLSPFVTFGRAEWGHCARCHATFNNRKYTSYPPGEPVPIDCPDEKPSCTCRTDANKHVHNRICSACGRRCRREAEHAKDLADAAAALHSLSIPLPLDAPSSPILVAPLSMSPPTYEQYSPPVTAISTPSSSFLESLQREECTNDDYELDYESASTADNVDTINQHLR